MCGSPMTLYRLCFLLAILLHPGYSAAQVTRQANTHVPRPAIYLTLEDVVDMAMGQSYRIRQLALGIERIRQRILYS